MLSLTLKPTRKQSESHILCCSRLTDNPSYLSSKLPESTSLVYCIVDEHVWNSWQTQVREFLQTQYSDVLFHVIQATEENKSLDTVATILQDMQESGCDRSSVVVGCGGGITTDIAGFVASVYMRGIDVVTMPTSLLAMVDAAVGGKNGVNSATQKNVFGTIVQPVCVIIATEFLQSLPAVEHTNGWAEVIKMAAITQDKFLWEALEENRHNVPDIDAEPLLRIIHRCCELKAEIVEQDESDQSKRAILNFGHTVGHAIEAATGFRVRHGFAIAEGMRYALHWSIHLAGLAPDRANRIVELLDDYGLHEVAAARLAPETLLTKMRSDKKRLQGTDRLVLLGKHGKAVVREVPYESLEIPTPKLKLCKSVLIGASTSTGQLPSHESSMLELCFQPDADLVAWANSLPEKQCVVTIRNADCEFDAAEVQRLREEALRGGHYVDIDFNELPAYAHLWPHGMKQRLVVSAHYVKSEEQAREIMQRVSATFPHSMLKIILDEHIPHPMSTCSRLRRYAEHLGMYRHAVHCMSGDQSTRLFGAVDGNVWTYVTDDVKSAVAVGQIREQDAVAHYRLQDACASTVLFGLIGNPVQQSPGFKLHNTLLHRFNCRGLYIPVLVRDIEDFVQHDLSLFRGVSVTMPWKQDVAQALSLPEHVNTLVQSNEGWSGHNTDVLALQTLLPQGESALVKGTGSTARSVVQALKFLGYANIVVNSRNQQRADAFAIELGVNTVCDHSYDVVVNATPVGMNSADESPFSVDIIQQTRHVFDCVYNPHTALRARAEDCGIVWQGGQAMFVEQAVKQFELFTGTDASGVDRDELISLCFADDQ